MTSHMACLELHQRYNKHVAERHISKLQTCEIEQLYGKIKETINQSTIKKKNVRSWISHETSIARPEARNMMYLAGCPDALFAPRGIAFRSVRAKRTWLGRMKMREVFLCANTRGTNAKTQLEGRGAHGMEVRKASEAPNFHSLEGFSREKEKQRHARWAKIWISGMISRDGPQHSHIFACGSTWFGSSSCLLISGVAASLCMLFALPEGHPCRSLKFLQNLSMELLFAKYGCVLAC